MTPEQIHNASESMKTEYMAQLTDADNTSSGPEISENVDIYQQNVNKRKENLNKPIKRGTSTLTKEIALEELEKLSKAKKRAEMDSNYFADKGESERAQMVKDQYIEERFLPAVEMVIIASTPDEVLNSREILDKFDDLSLQYGPGYTASYIRTAYGDQIGTASSQSDGYIRSQVERLKYLSSSDQLRAAYGLAKRIKDEIDNGEHMADSQDYEIISRVASIG